MAEPRRAGGYSGGFAADGPTHCSGLPTARCSARQLAAEFPDLAVAGSDYEVHRTPAGTVQPFTWLLLRSPDTTGG